MARKIYTALEDYAGLPEDLLTVQDMVEVNEDSAVINDLSSELTEQQETLAESIKAFDDAEKTKDILEEVVSQSSPLTETSAQLIQESIKVFSKRLGMKMSPQFPSLESFRANKDVRLENTELTLETFKDSLKEAWDKIIAFLQKIWKNITEFFKKLVNGRYALKKKIESLYKNVNLNPESVTLKENVILKIPFMVTADGVNTEKENGAAMFNSIDGAFRLLDNTAKEIKDGRLNKSVETLAEAIVNLIKNIQQTGTNVGDGIPNFKNLDVDRQKISDKIKDLKKEVKEQIQQTKEKMLEPSMNSKYKSESGSYEVSSLQFSRSKEDFIKDINAYVQKLYKLSGALEKDAFKESLQKEINDKAMDFARNQTTVNKTETAKNIEFKIFKDHINALMIFNSSVNFLNMYIYKNTAFLYKIVYKLTTMIVEYTPDAKLLTSK